MLVCNLLSVSCTRSSRDNWMQHPEDLKQLGGFDITIYNLYNDYLSRDKSKAMTYAEILLKNVDSCAVSMTVASVAETLADYYANEIFTFSEAIALKERCLSIYMAAKETTKACSAMHDLASLNFKLGKYHKTLNYSYQVLECGEAAPEDVLDCKNLIAISCSICKDTETAKKYFFEFEKTAREQKDSSRLFKALNNVAVYHITISQDTVKARQLLSEAVRVCNGIRDSSSMFIVYYNLANTYLATGDTDTGKRLLDKAELMAGDIREKGQYYYTYGAYLFKLSRYDESAEALEKSISYFSEGEFEIERMKCLELLRELYDLTGDTDKAYQTLIQYSDLEGKFGQIEMYRDLFQAQNAFDKRIEEEILNKKRNVAILVCIILLLVITIAIFIAVSKYRKKFYTFQKQEAEIKTKKEMLELIKLQSFQTDRLIREILERLAKVRQKVDKSSVREELSQICGDLKNSKNERQWKELEHFVPEYNSELFDKLLMKIPNLTVNERRLCVFLNMNLTTKEISSITHQTEQSIIRARYRLRHKLGITGSTISIPEFLAHM